MRNLIHRRLVPIRGAAITIQEAFTGETAGARSSEEGDFAFRRIREGLCVVRAEGGRSERDFDTATYLIAVDPNARGERLVIMKSDPVVGSFGGTTLEVASKP